MFNPHFINTVISPNFLEITFVEIALNSAETFPQDFYARKLGENTVFYAGAKRVGMGLDG